MMLHLLFLLATYVLNALWQVALLGAVAWLVSFWLKRVGPQAQHVVWVASLLFGIVTPALPVILTLSGIRTGRETAAVHALTSAAVASTTATVSSSAITLPPILVAILSLAYLCVLFYFGARFVWLLRRTSAMRSNAQPHELDPDAAQAWRLCTQEFSLRGVLILRSHEVAGPVTIGVRLPILLVPERFAERCSAPDLLAALAHECAHMRRRDFAKNLLYELFSLAIAFHPVTWLMKSQIAQTREMVCDAMATRSVIDAHTYTSSLLRLVTMMDTTARAATTGAIGIFDANILEKRVMTMRMKKPALRMPSRLALIVPGALLLLSAAASAATMAKSIEEQEPASASGTAKHHARIDLACTYYDAQGQGLDGTCGRQKDSRTSYICTANGKPTMSQEQAGCEWKVQRAENLRSVTPGR